MRVRAAIDVRRAVPTDRSRTLDGRMRPRRRIPCGDTCPDGCASPSETPARLRCHRNSAICSTNCEDDLTGSFAAFEDPGCRRSTPTHGSSGHSNRFWCAERFSGKTSRSRGGLTCLPISCRRSVKTASARQVSRKWHSRRDEPRRVS